ncbi:MAG TPA: exosortase, partial [Planctomycetaceae bacterium]|nr:exosortase [Planctomycetaceae bacterium]
MARPAAGPGDASAQPDLTRQIETPRPSRLQLGIAIGLLLAFGAWCYWPTLRELVRVWDSSPDYSHGYLVIPLAAWFLWLRRRRVPWFHFGPSWWGFSLIALAAGLRLIGARFYIPELDSCSLPIWAAGACWLLGGWRFLLWASPALGFLFFMVPLPATIETLLNRPLQNLATTMSTWTLQSLGQPAIAEGSTILLGDNILEVERACSGLRMFYGIFALAVATIIMTRARWSVALCLLASVAPVAILANVLRITTTGLLYDYASTESAKRFSHDLAGILMIVVAIAFFMLVLWTTERMLLRFRRTRARAFIQTAIAFLIIAALVPVGYFWHESQQSRTVDRFLKRADKLQEEGKDLEAISFLDRYLHINRNDMEVRVRLVHAVDKVANNPLRKIRAMELYRETWNLDRNRVELGERCANLEIELARYDEALNTSAELAAINLSPTESTPEAQAEAARRTSEARRTAARLKALALLGRSMRADVVTPEDEWQKIVAAFQEAIRQNPKDIELAVRLADIERHQLKSAAAKDRQKVADGLMDAMVERNRERPEAFLARYLYWKSLTAAAEPVSTGSDADLDRALEIGHKDPKKENADALLFAGERAADKKDLPTARQFFERATVVRPTDYRGWTRLGQLVAEEGTDAARSHAVEIWTKGVASVHEYDMELVLPLAATLVQLRRFADAEEKLRPLDASLPRLMEPGRSLVELGTARLRAAAAAAQGNPVLATTTLRSVLNGTRAGTASAVYRTPFADGWMQLGDYYTDLKLDDEAAEAYESAGRLDERVPQWQTKAALAAQRSGRPGDSAQHLRDVVRRDPSPTNWLALARANFLEQISLAPARRNWHDFREAFNKVAASKTNGGPLTLMQAEYQAGEGQLDESAKTLTLALSRSPKAWQLWQALAMVQERRKDAAETKKAIEQFEKYAPDRDTVVSFEARQAVEAGHFDEARQILEKATPSLSAPGKIAARDQLIEVDLRQGRRQEARRRLEEAAAEAPADLQILETLGQTASDDRDWKAVEDIETRLKKVEGDDGTLWRELRVRRQLAQIVESDDPRFREAERTTREIAALRPNWQRRWVLQGLLARRMNQPDEAIAAYQQAIRLGNRSIGLSEELIDLLNEQHRFTEADREFDRVRQAVARSSRLSSAAIPIYVRRGESDEALRLAEDWVRRQPQDASCYVRLGRTLLLTTPETSSDYAKVVKRAQAAYEHAVELAPSDVRMWVVLFRFYTGVQKNAEAANTMLTRLAQRIDVPETQRVFVLAQLYEAIGNRVEAGRFYLAAIKSAPADSQVTVMQRAAQFFVTDDPAQAEAYCRQILKLRPKSVDARRVLVRALAEEGGEEHFREAAGILADLAKNRESSLGDKRLEAILLARTGNAADRQRATELLEGFVQIPQQAARQDRVLLASLYETDQRLMPAYEQLLALSRQDDASVADLVRYAEFLLRNEGEQPQFADYAEPVLNRLEQDPLNRVSAVRLRLAAVSKLPAVQRTAKGRLIIDRAAKRFVSEEKDAVLRRDSFTKLLVLLTRQELSDEATRLVVEAHLCSDLDTAIALADALTLLPRDSQLSTKGGPILKAALAKNPRSAELLYSLGNLRYVGGARDEAIAFYRRSLEVRPEDKLTLNNLALALGDRKDGIAEGLTTIDRAIQKFGNDVALLDTKGQLLVATGRSREGLALLIEA